MNRHTIGAWEFKKRNKHSKKGDRYHAFITCSHIRRILSPVGPPSVAQSPLDTAKIEQIIGVKGTAIPEENVFLMLVGGGLRIVHATLHERLQTALKRITPELVERAARTADSALRQLNVKQPRIGVFGINPHAGEGGLFGDDDENITVPAVKRLQAAGFDVEGPVGADLMLGRRDCDAFVAMYHDQGHIPVKLMAGRNSAAMSIGAGVLFSSVGHGSAFDVAGRGLAEPDAVFRSLKLVSGATDLAELGAS